MKKTAIIIGILLLIVMIFISSCQPKDDSLTPSTGQTWDIDNDNSGALNPIDSNDSTAEVKEFAIESYSETIDWKFFPKFSLKNIEVNEGDTVKITVNATNGEHNFMIDEYNVSVETPINQETVIEFVADKAWTFEYYCSKPWHRAMWQWGTLTVNPKK